MGHRNRLPGVDKTAVPGLKRELLNGLKRRFLTMSDGDDWTDGDDLTRRRILRGSAVTALGAAGLSSQASGLLGVNVDSSAGDAQVEVDESGASAEANLLGVEQIPTIEARDAVNIVAPTAVPESASGIRPGSQILVHHDDGVHGCSANFVWRDGGSLYLGTAGHCFLDGAPASSEFAEGNGDDVSGLTVTVCTNCTFGGATGLSVVRGQAVELGDVVYARQEEPGGGEGVGHDFGLVEIPSELEDLVDPSLPQFGGPTGEVDGAVPSGDPVVQYGAGVGNGETYLTQGSRGFSLGPGPADGSWTAGIRASPGDSGSALSAATDATTFEGDGAAGVLTHLTASGTAGTTVDRCVEMVAEDGLTSDLEVVLP